MSSNTQNTCTAALDESVDGGGSVGSNQSKKRSVSVTPSPTSSREGSASALYSHRFSFSSSNIKDTMMDYDEEDSDEDHSQPPTAKLARVGSLDKSEHKVEHQEEKEDQHGEEDEEKGQDEDIVDGQQEDVEMKSFQSDESFDFCSDSDKEDESDDDGAVIVHSRASISSSFDMRLLRDSIDQGRPILERIIDQDVVLILGKTGVGKSSLVQALAGKKFMATTHTTERFGQVVEKMVFDIAPDSYDTDSSSNESQPLPGFEIGHVKESKTKHINCHALVNSKNENFNVVDSPGWEDTAGPEVDIATACMTAAVAAQAKNVVFVILINYASLLEDRGGAMRSVLKLVRNLVPDFQASQRSFMFLFTHTNEISSIPKGSLDHARKALLAEIIRTDDGTQDEQVKQMLRFMRMSLKKGYPFCDVFHPLLSDASKILTNLNRLKWTPNSQLTAATNGGAGLTTASRYKLQGELTKLGQSLLHVLSDQGVDASHPTNIVQAKDILDIFTTLEQYVDIDSVRQAATEARQVACQFIRRMHSRIQQVVTHGTDRNLDFGTAHVADLVQCTENLRALNDLFPSEADYENVVAHVKRQVERFQNQLLVTPLDGVHHQLGTLRAWADLIDDFKPSYQKSITTLSMFIGNHVSQVLAFHENVELSSASEQQLKEYVGRLKVLQTIESNAQHLSSHLDVTRATETLRSVIAGHCATLESWAEMAESQLHVAGAVVSSSSSPMETDEVATAVASPMETEEAATTTSSSQMETDNTDPLETVVNRAKVVGILSGLLDDDLVCPALQEKAQSVRNSLAETATTYYGEACTDLKKTFESLAPASVEERMQFLSRAHGLFVTVGHPKWTDEISRSSRPVFDELKSFLKTKSGELEEMAASVSLRGVVNGQRDGDALTTFASFKFFDLFLGQRERFVENCYTAYKRTYEDRAEYVRVSIEQCLMHSRASGEKGHCSSLEELRSLKTLLLEQREIAHLSVALADEGLSTTVSDSNDKILHCIDELATRANIDVSLWKAAVRESPVGKDIPRLTDKLGSVLREIELLHELGIGREKLVSIRSEIRREGESFVTEVQGIIDNEYCYPAKFKCLSALHEIEKASADHHQSIVTVNFQQAKERVREGIKAHAHLIESMVSETSEWDEIDCLLKKLERAEIVDEFTSGEASSRLAPLRKLREQKEEEVDEMLEQYISEQNYHGLRQFLQPLVDSKDQVKQQKFDCCLNKIASSLSDIFADVRRRLNFTDLSDEDLNTVAVGLGKIEKANQELGQYLNSNAHSLQLGEELKKAKNKVNRKFVSFLEKTEKAARALDFVALGTSNCRAVQFKSHLAPFLSSQSESKSIAALTHYREATEMVSSKAGAFFTSKFDDVGILQNLVSLKNASAQSSPQLPKLTTLYEETKSKLTDRLRTYLSRVRNDVSKLGCFDDAIGMLSLLDQQPRKGLEDFVCSPELVAEIRSQHESWCEERLQTERGLFGSDASLETIKAWKEELDRREKGRNLDWLFGQSQAYPNLRSKVAKAAEDKLAAGMRAVRNREYPLVQECIETLDLMENHLKKHIPSISRGATQLKKEAVDAFDNICEKTKEILASDNNRRQFQEVFDNYRRLVTAVPSVTSSASSKRCFSLTNQLIFDALRNCIAQLDEWRDSFDFSSLKTKIERARLFGGYVADYVTLFQEEVRCCEHLGDDKWLDKIFQLCQENFSCGRNLHRIQLYVLLDVPPSATKTQIKKAFRAQAKKHHPDKRSGSGPETDEGAMFRKIKEASEELENIAPSTVPDEKPFDALLMGVGDSLHKQIKTLLSEQRYVEVAKLFYHLSELHVLDSLVTPQLQSQQTKDALTDLVKNHVDKVRIEVDSNWAERNYKALNDNIADLKQMEEKFKTYPQIFSASWNTGIADRIEKEIDKLGNQARQYLVDQASAKKCMQDFRRLFLKMGFVLVELAPFKQHTKEVMSDVLESCLARDWGYGYLFDFGLSLQRSDESSSDEENLVAQVVLSEFAHFKEVLTMVWNEETSQKPAEDTVCDIRGHVRKGLVNETLKVDKDFLLQSFRDFFGEYRSLLGEYLDPDADLKVLVQNVTCAANKLKPISCDSGWGVNTKRQIPQILAGVFAVFTILKSGTSYNRIGTTDDDGGIGEKLLMKPHNIQVLTLLCMFGCSSPSADSLDSQLMQIRTGEGKSMLLGAGAVVLGLLGFQTRCVCYSEYLSARDYNLFKEVFDLFQLTDLIKYSKITTLSEDTTAAKGDIRFLTEKLLRGQLKKSLSIAKSNRSHRDTDVTMVEATSPSTESGASSAVSRSKARHDAREEILLVDEVDVFFGSEFYGQTYNQVALVHEPEVEDILRQIWDAKKRGGRRLRLSDVQGTHAYKRLLQKMPEFKFLVDNEISSMLSQVRLVDEEPYYLDQESGRIGYKVMDSISYDVTYGYRTVFAYLKEADKGTLRSRDSILSNVMAMQVSCGQFSYANISPGRILGVSGTLDAMGDYENNILSKYGISKFLFVPSVYGQSNFSFDKAGDGIMIDSNKSDYFHSITDQILQTATKDKRAVIVFFRDKKRMDEFTSSSFYRKLGRQKKLLTEEMPASEKEFVISKAATCGQITISSAVFGRGTDFFCKDDRVQKHGGVHVVQAFLSGERSEEIQIQGRTARQGKKGSYQMVLLESDLRDDFGIPMDTIRAIAKSDLYPFLCQARQKQREKHYQTIDHSLTEATACDNRTHRYFDALLVGERGQARRLFSDLYKSFKKKQMPKSIDVDLAFVVDVTGSMGPYAAATADTLKCIINGPSSIATKLQAKFPEIQFKIRTSFLGYRDVDDKSMQFQESTWRNGGHFTASVDEVSQFITKTLASPSGGADIAEDHLGAINRCSTWQSPGDWQSQIKFMMLMTDAPGHGMVPQSCAGVANADNYSMLHPAGLTLETVVGNLIKRDIDLFFCSFNPSATRRTEEELAQQYLDHPENKGQLEVTVIPMVSQSRDTSVVPMASGSPGSTLVGDFGKHIIFVLDESGSMSCNWSGVVEAYNQYLHRRRQNQSDSDLVSVVQFDNYARTTVNLQTLSAAPTNLGYRGGGTNFHPAAVAASQIAAQTPSSHTPVVVFMSDGGTYDSAAAAEVFVTLNREILRRTKSDLELHVIGFGGGADTQQLQQIAKSSRNGKIYSSASTAELSNIFVNIAGGQDVAGLLEAEVGKRISEAVADRLAVEYLA